MNDPDYPNPDEDDIDYSVAFCYEFLEDARDKEQRYIKIIILSTLLFDILLL